MSVKRYTTGYVRKWEARYYIRTPDGKLKYTVKKGFHTKKEAEQWEATHKHTSSAPHGTTFMDVFEAMSLANNANSVTTAQRRVRMSTYCETFKYLNMDSITKQMLIEWRACLIERELKPRTINDIIGVVQQVFRFGYDTYDMYDSAKVLKSVPVPEVPTIVIINFEQLKKLLENEHDEEMRTFFRFLFFSGCRKGEARALKKADFDGKAVHIYKSMRRDASTLKTTKNGVSRVVPLDDETCRQLQKLMDGNGEYLFGDYEPLSNNKITDHFKKDLERSKLPDMRIHDLRHSNVSLLWHAGVPVPEISKRIGHRTVKTTMEVYAHIFDNEQTASLNALNALK